MLCSVCIGLQSCLPVKRLSVIVNFFAVLMSGAGPSTTTINLGVLADAELQNMFNEVVRINDKATLSLCFDELANRYSNAASHA